MSSSNNNNYRSTLNANSKWFHNRDDNYDEDYDCYYRDERIISRAADSSSENSETLPEPIRTIRYMAKSVSSRNLSRQELFFQQALFLADYDEEVNYVYDREVIRYFPTYQSLSDRELRAYFSWRTNWRKGVLRRTSLSFAFIYIYELLHLVGCSSAQEAYENLTALSRDYAVFDPKITTYLRKWIRDFVVYYELDPNLLADTEEIRRDKALFVLIDMQNRTDSEIFQAVLELSDSVLKNSRFFKKYPQAMESVVAGILRQLESHYAKSCKKVWTENYFGTFLKHQLILFDKAVFFDRRHIKEAQTDLSPLCHYRCVNGIWFVYCCEYKRLYHKRFLNLLRTIDALLRDAFNFPHPMQPKIKTKWLIIAINEEIKKWQEAELRAQLAARKREVHFDLSQLGSIRSDAAETSEKLLTEEETDEEREKGREEKTFENECANLNKAMEKDENLSSNNDDDNPFHSLTEQEKRYLQCLLDKTSANNWLASEGLLPSLLCDSINEKLYDFFGDNVLENGMLVEDYEEDLREELKN